jgi:hypothetical protein
MSHHTSGPDFGFPHGDARLGMTDLYAFTKPGDPVQIRIAAARVWICSAQGESAQRRVGRSKDLEGDQS